MSKIELYHGTTAQRIQPFLKKGEDLFGMRKIGLPNFSGNLTNDYDVSRGRSYRGREVKQTPIILVFWVPENLLIDEGPIEGWTVASIGYSTTLEVPPALLTPNYLAHLGLTVESAIQQVARNEISFFRVPHNYLFDKDLSP